jgi:hypothetical protein
MVGIAGSKMGSAGGTPLSALLPFLIIAVFALLHVSLLRLPFFWDEAGYYIPAARDFFLSGSLVPYSTLHTAHTPLLSLFLAAIWKITGYGVLITRIVMLAVACFGLWQVYRLAENVANRSVALASLALTAAYPVVFAQSSIAHSDLLATALVWWGLREYFEPSPKPWRYALAFTLAVLAKEIVIVVPGALALFALARLRRPGIKDAFALCFAPALALACWFTFQRFSTGQWLGDPDYYRYNVSATLTPARVFFAFIQRFWQAFGHMNMWVATLAMILAMFLTPKSQRDRIPIPTQLAFASVILATILFHSILGGALLTRYMLAIYPLILIIAVSTWWRRVPRWHIAAGLAVALFALACVVNPPYRFAPEDNLSYADFIRVHQSAAKVIESRFLNVTVVAAWPATDELHRPELGYVTRPVQVKRIHDYTSESLSDAAEMDFDVLLAFSTKYEPEHPWFRSRWWTELSTRYFDYHQDLDPADVANAVGGRMIWQERRHGQWAAIIVRELPQNAQLRQPQGLTP